MKNLLKLSLSVCLLSMLVIPESYAVPAFGRAAGNVGCNACHATPTWQLNKYGLDFLRNGHRGEAKEFAVEDIKWDNYLSLVWKGRASYTEKANPRTQFEQHSFSIYTGGPLSERFSYFTEMYLSENTGSTSGSNIVQGDAARKKLAEAFLQYNQPITEKSFVAFRFGAILPEILHTFGIGARSLEDRATMFQTYVNSSNPWRPFTRAQGVDAKFNSEHFEFAVGSLVGAGAFSGSNASTNAIDDNNHKDLYGSAMYEIDKNGSAVGAYHYRGLQTVSATFKNEFDRTIFLARYVLPENKGRFTGAYMMGNEEISATSEQKNKGYYALVDYNLNPNYGLYARYDFVDPKDTDSFSEVKLYTVGFNGLLFENKSSAARWSVDFSQRETTKTSASATDQEVKKIAGQLTWAL